MVADLASIAVAIASLEPPAGHSRVSSSVFGIPMAEVILCRAEIHALVGQIVAAGVAQHVWMHMPEAGPFKGDLYRY